MIAEISESKWIQGIYPDTPCVLAARRALAVRLKAVEHMIRQAAHPTDDNPEYVHQLRVASRRAAAALRVFHDYFGPKAVRSARNALRRVRRAASLARSCDVHRSILAEEARKAPLPARPAVATVMSRLEEDRALAQKALMSAEDEYDKARVRRKLARAILLPRRPGGSRSGGVRIDPGERPYTFGALIESVLPPLIEDFSKYARADLNDAPALHRLRIASKKLRYALEIASSCLPKEFSTLAYDGLVRMQSRLGRINDFADMQAMVTRIASKYDRQRVKENGSASSSRHDGLVALAEHFENRLERSTRRFLRWFDAMRQRKIEDALRTLASVPVPSHIRDSGGRQHAAVRNASSPFGLQHRRVAAIDIGTNSIRMAVAETDPAVGFRIIEDMKETTRLGSGMYRGGKLKVGAVDRSLGALARMRTIAEGYKVDAFRAVATSAVREASNGADFVKLVRRRIGIPIEVIPPQREARLAFSGVSRDFELADHRIAVVDTGGGSTELIFASSAVIDAIRPLGLGAVRLTEKFERPGEPGRYRFAAMKRYIDKALAKSMRRVPYRPEFIVGAGGTFTSLARVALRQGMDADKAGHFPFAVRGCELRHKALLRILKSLRRMTLQERSQVSGLSAQRAEIIVAGLCIVERLMRFLRVDRLIVHDGGIRDGLVAEMIDELGFRSQYPRTHPGQMLGAVGRYAERMRFPKAHSEHVARLAMRIFDGLAKIQPDAAGTWASPAHRDLLHSAALLHDVGRRIELKRHHRHSYDMIVHADLATLTRREIEIIAQTARYHRKAGPRRSDPAFRKLGADDQRLVAHLAGILRVADGLDYSQKQHVSGVAVQLREDEICFEITAREDAKVEMQRAAKKADVFESAFRTRTRFQVRAEANEPVAACG